MILFICEQQDNLGGMRHFTGLATRGGEKCGLYVQEKCEPSLFAQRHCEQLAEDIAGFEIFRFNAQHDNFKCQRYGETPAEILDSAIPWYAHYIRLLENQIWGLDIDHVVTWGSSLLGNKAAVLAAEDLGLRVSCIEDGWFRLHRGEYSTRTFTMTAGRAYYERLPQAWVDGFAEFEHDEQRFADYREWWLANRQTKYSGRNRQEVMIEEGVDLPPEWGNGDHRVVWFGQLYGDAATYWLTDSGEEQIKAAGGRKQAWYKPHPFTQETNAPTGLRLLPQEAHIHDLLPETDEALVLTSNVGLEARLFDIPVDVFGDPFYKHFAGDRGTDYIIHELQFAADDHKRFAELLHDDI